MQVGDAVWIFDGNIRKYTNDECDTNHLSWHRRHFEKRFIIGETSRSWLVDYKGGNPDNAMKVNKKTLTYKGCYGQDGILYTSEEMINKQCWVQENRYELSDMVRKCNDYETLKQIYDLLCERT